MRKWWAIALSLIVLLPPLTLFPGSTGAFSDQTSNLNVGPYVDELAYRVIPSYEERVAGLFSERIDLDLDTHDVRDTNVIVDNSPVDVYSFLRNGYGQITINTREYPLNISGLRRAFAFAYDKEYVQQELFGGYSILHDSVVPNISSFSIENELEWHYYGARPDIGNQILDELGFTVQADGWRRTPEGHAIDLEIIHSWRFGDIGVACAQAGVDALESLHIQAHTLLIPFSTYDLNLSCPCSYDMIFGISEFESTDVDWLADSYSSEMIGEPYQNPSNFANATFDELVDDLLGSATYEQVYAAAAEMQRILHHNVPTLVLYEDWETQFYGNTKFTGHLGDLVRTIAGPWTMRKIHRIDGTLGGTVTIALAQEPDSFNIFTTNWKYSKVLLSELYLSLYKRAPDQTPYPYLAKNMIAETHADNDLVPDGHTRFTFDIIENATWSDGAPLTAADVAFTFNYILESGLYRNPAADVLTDLITATAPTPYKVVLEFRTESYWLFSMIAYTFIIPLHIFTSGSSFGPPYWSRWNPVYDSTHPLVTAGPFIMTDSIAGEYYTLVANPSFAFLPERLPTPTTTGNSTGPHNGLIDLQAIALSFVSGFSFVIIVGIVILMIRDKKTT